MWKTPSLSSTHYFIAKSETADWRPTKNKRKKKTPLTIGKSEMDIRQAMVTRLSWDGPISDSGVEPSDGWRRAFVLPPFYNFSTTSFTRQRPANQLTLLLFKLRPPLELIGASVLLRSGSFRTVSVDCHPFVRAQSQRVERGFGVWIELREVYKKIGVIWV